MASTEDLCQWLRAKGEEGLEPPASKGLHQGLFAQSERGLLRPTSPLPSPHTWVGI